MKLFNVHACPTTYKIGLSMPSTLAFHIYTSILYSTSVACFPHHGPLNGTWQVHTPLEIDLTPEDTDDAHDDTDDSEHESEAAAASLLQRFYRKRSSTTRPSPRTQSPMITRSGAQGAALKSYEAAAKKAKKAEAALQFEASRMLEEAQAKAEAAEAALGAARAAAREQKLSAAVDDVASASPSARKTEHAKEVGTWSGAAIESVGEETASAAGATGGSSEHTMGRAPGADEIEDKLRELGEAQAQMAVLQRQTAELNKKMERIVAELRASADRDP